MLLRFSISNFLSFYNTVRFDMFPNPNRVRFVEHIYNHSVPLLKESAIYGPNGSGKSNFIKAVLFFKLFLTEKDFLKGIDVKTYKYRLIDKNNKPIVFEMEFTTKGCYYVYKVGIGESLYEELLVSGIGKAEDELVFKREGSRITSSHVENRSSAEKLLSLNPISSVLPLNSQFPIFSSKDVDNAYQWLKENVVVVNITSKLPTLIHLMSAKPDIMKFADKMLSECDLNIMRFSIKENRFEEWIKSHRNLMVENLIDQNTKDAGTGIEFGQDARNVFNVYKDSDGERKVQEMIFEQIGINGYRGDMDILSQSDGTVRLLTLIPAIYDAMYGEKTVFIDEIENSMHPMLIYNLMKYYSTHRTNGQLIYTTHLTKLMDQQELLRLDEYWLTQKINGQTNMRSLSDYRIHNTINIENGYLQGRYNGVPHLSMEVDNDAENI